MTPTRRELLTQASTERIDLANAADYVAPGIDYSKRPGYPTRERVAEWNRDWIAMCERERAEAVAQATVAAVDAGVDRAVLVDAPVVDVEELARWLATEPKDGHELWCARCRDSYSLGDSGDAPSTFCDNCAHLVCENAVPLLIAEIRALRAMRLAAVDVFHGTLDALEALAKVMANGRPGAPYARAINELRAEVPRPGRPNMRAVCDAHPTNTLPCVKCFAGVGDSERERLTR